MPPLRVPFCARIPRAAAQDVLVYLTAAAARASLHARDNENTDTRLDEFGAYWP